MSEVQPNIDRSIEFLKKFYPKGPWVLTCIRTDKKAIEGGTFGPGTEQDARNWLIKWSKPGDRNIYFSANEVQGEVTRKAEKSQIVRAGWLYVDIDAQEGVPVEQELDRILLLLGKNRPTSIPEPTVGVYSGGGFQFFWKLKTPVEIKGEKDRWEAYEAYNKRLEQVFDADHCHNVDRIMRLPGTVNNPDAKKLSKGRQKALAKVFYFNTLSYELEEHFKPATSTQTAGNVMQDAAIGASPDIDLSGSENNIMDLSELDEWDVPDRVKVIIAQGRHPEKPKEGDNSRSSWVFDVVCNLIRCGVPDGVIYSILMDKEWGISESVLEQKDPSRYAIKQISTAHGFTTDPDLQFMNDRHAVIGNIGGKCRVIEEVPDETLGRTRITYSSFEDIRNRYNNVKVMLGTGADGKPILVPRGTYWIANPKRQQFDYIKFMPNGAPPNIFNLWRGFAVVPKQGNCQLYLDHLKENVCGGNEEYYDYLIKWMARAVQNPAQQGQVAVVLRGGKGTGKGVTAKYFGMLFGRHFMHISNPSHLVGNFNSHLKDAIVLFADEAFYAGDKKHESVLKMLVTEDSIPIEQKHVDVEAYPNYIHLIMAANDAHVIRATGDERRYFVLEVLNSRQQNTEYFAAIDHQMVNEGGLEALLFMLQSMDLSDFEVRKPPQTSALQDQKNLSLAYDEEWWFQKLQTGRLLDKHHNWETVIPTDTLAKDFTDYLDTWKIMRRGNETAFTTFLGRIAPHMRREQRMMAREMMGRDGYMETKKQRTWVYDLGTLDQCRAEWERINGKFSWPVYREDTPETFGDAF